MARIVRRGDTGDPDLLPELLQLVFFFRMACGSATIDSHGAVGLRNLLPAKTTELFVSTAPAAVSNPKQAERGKGGAYRQGGKPRPAEPKARLGAAGSLEV